MADKLSKAARSKNMSRIKSKNTKPELLVRRELYKVGMRYRLHRKDLPGKPDIVIQKSKLAIFVNGCFWHRHENCAEASRPKTNSEFWEAKISANVDRDVKNYSVLKQMGWNVVVLWECEILKDLQEVVNLIKDLYHNGL